MMGGAQKAGSYVISVSLGTGCYRHIQISCRATFFQLHEAILEAFAFFDDHAHAFFLDNSLWSDRDSLYADMIEEADRYSGDVRLDQAGLVAGKKFKYVFDFGDEWVFQCKVLKCLDEPAATPAVVRAKGEAPPQYGGPDEDEPD